MVDRILFGPFVQQEVKDPMEVTAKAGWAPIPGGYQRAVVEFPADQAVAIDKQAWDWTMPKWVIAAYFDAKMRQCRNPDDFWLFMCLMRFYHIFGPGTRYIFPDGATLEQQFWGVMKSGCYLTLSMNSAAQFFQHAVAAKRTGWNTVPKMWAMGDDMLVKMDPEVLEPYLENLKTTGCIVKQAELSREFAGFRIEGDNIANAKCRPLYEEKHKFMIAWMKPELEDQVMISFSLLYALDPPSWLLNALYRSKIRLGPKQRQWAKGLINLKMLDFVPTLFRFWD
uniref:RNA-directed RNA polymerase n=1 Tax=Riboviria sp. TaxID=2585031 RepID=A0A8K1JF77_9VIRU|nr:MAG: hypothetical protein 2 [Riboviria sp.]